MKKYKQVHVICYDRGFKFEEIRDIQEFHNESDAVKFIEAHQKKLQDINFYNDPIVILRKEVSYCVVKQY